MSYDGRAYCRVCGLDFPCGLPDHDALGPFVNDDPDDYPDEPTWNDR